MIYSNIFNTLRISTMFMFKISVFIIIGTSLPATNSRSTATSNIVPHVGRTTFIESNSIQRHIENTSGRSIYGDSKALKRVFLSNRTVTCNDGSQAGFYLRKSSTKSKRWVVFFEGGWHCYDIETCKTRWTKSRHLMTSAKWLETREDGGILSPMATENPYWHDANHVLVPYCSSDSWSGTRMQAKDRWTFMGSLIVRQVIADLIPLGLGRSQGGELLLAGSSAGGLGVMLNLDKVRRFLREEREIKIAVRGVSDSGWFLDREPYAVDAISAAEVVKQGWRLWEGSLPESCANAHPTEPWRCYFGHRLYPTLKSPLFVFQWLFDEAQMRADSVGAPVTKKQWDYIHETGISLRGSLDNVTAVFAPSCIGHAVLTKRDWLNIKIDEISLPEALRCWEQSTNGGGGGGGGGRNHKELSRRASDGQKKINNRRRRRRKNNLERTRKQQQRQQERQERHRLAKEKRQQQKRRNGGKFKNHTMPVSLAQVSAGNVGVGGGGGRGGIPRPERSPTATGGGNNKQMKNGQRNGGGGGGGGGHGLNKNKKRKNQSNEHNNRNTNHKRRQQHQQQQIQISEPSRCSLRLLERCSWPQCNHSCPSITNPLTGKEMRFLELLASFGLDIEAVATALGVDMPTLSNMDRTELLNLLTQTS